MVRSLRDHAASPLMLPQGAGQAPLWERHLSRPCRGPGEQRHSRRNSGYHQEVDRRLMRGSARFWRAKERSFGASRQSRPATRLGGRGAGYRLVLVADDPARRINLPRCACLSFRSVTRPEAGQKRIRPHQHDFVGCVRRTKTTLLVFHISKFTNQKMARMVSVRNLREMASRYYGYRARSVLTRILRCSKGSELKLIKPPTKWKPRKPNSGKQIGRTRTDTGT